MMQEQVVIPLIEQNVKPAWGCTDPITLALAAAAAYRKLGGRIKVINASVSQDLYKGARSVYIPGTGLTGIPLALALGTIINDFEKGLLILDNITANHLERAKDLVNSTPITVKSDGRYKQIYAEVTVETSNGTGRAIVSGRHDGLRLIEVNKEKQEFKEPLQKDYTKDLAVLNCYTLEDYLQFVRALDPRTIAFLHEGIEINRSASKAGQKEGCGMGIGEATKKEMLFSNHHYFMIKAFVSSAVDARMGGQALPVVTAFGSGNQGIIIFNTLSFIGEYLKIPYEKVLGSICLTLLLAGNLNYIMKEGTPFCDCALIASTSTAGGIVYMMDGTATQIDTAVRLTANGLAGLLCDGAKPGCAQKVSLGVGAALEGADLALKGLNFLSEEGLLCRDFRKTFLNIAEVGSKLKKGAEKAIVNILMNNHCQ